VRRDWLGILPGEGRVRVSLAVQVGEPPIAPSLCLPMPLWLLPAAETGDEGGEAEPACVVGGEDSRDLGVVHDVAPARKEIHIGRSGRRLPDAILRSVACQMLY
jgi:hypothetical protein